MFSQSVFASNLLVMGDSLSAAYTLRQEQGWVSLLQNRLEDSGFEVKIVNASVSGETTQGGISRFGQLLEEYQPKWVVIELGANDALRGYPLVQTRQNLEMMVQQALKAKAEVLLLGNQIPQNYGKRYTQAFYSLYEQIATQYQLGYMPFMLEGVALNKELMLPDGLHPNEEGQKEMLENIFPYVDSLLKQE